MNRYSHHPEHSGMNWTIGRHAIFAFALAMVAIAPGASNTAAPALACGGAAVLAGVMRRARRNATPRFTLQAVVPVALLAGGAFTALAFRTPDGPGPAVWFVGATVFAAAFAFNLLNDRSGSGAEIA